MSLSVWKRYKRSFNILNLLLFLILDTSCAASKSQSSSIQVSWTSNRERAVNALGGGYHVYYSQTSGFSISSAKKVDVPYTSGTLAPTSTLISNLSPGTYYIKVEAYSALTPPNQSQGAVSKVSDEISVTLLDVNQAQ